MAIRRYNRAPILGVNKYYGTSTAHRNIRDGIEAGSIKYQETFLHEAERLDSIAGRFYDDATLWWVIAAASNIGWSLQVNPGILIRIPDLTDVSKVIS